MKLLIKNGKLIDPKNKRDGLFDVLIEKDQVLDVVKPGQKISADHIIDAEGCVVAPGFVDLHVHLREPGFEYKETIQTGTQAAAAGGFTSVCCMANTEPVNDNASVTKNILKQAKEVGLVNVYPIGAVTMGLKGQQLSPMGDLKRAGCVAFSDDGITVASSMMMRLAMEYAKSFELPIISHAVDPVLAGRGVMNEGFLSTKMGLAGIPHEAEDIIIARDLYLSKLTGAALHLAHITTAEGVNLVRRAKEEGLKVTAEVTPHHLTLTEAAVCGYDTHAKMAPPLRTQADIEALWKGLADGVIDAIATDHAPHGMIDKEVDFAEAACGVIGLETALGVCWTEAVKRKIPLSKLISALTFRPAEVVGIQKGSLEKGAVADVVIFNPEATWAVDSKKFYSKSHNCPFEGWKLKGVVKATLVAGKVVYQS